MADFRQLALEYVLGDDEPKLTSLAKQAAKELETAQATSNPVARWVESVQPWMPSRNGDDEEGQDLPDWTARAKALEFLSRTLDHIGKDVLKPNQVKLLVAFFGAMFDVDHKAGVMASATALTRITYMKSFLPTSALDIIQKLCALKDDFPRQIVKTRLAVYELIYLLISNEAVTKDLKTRQPGFEYILELLQLCRSERDPDCLIAWFDILRVFMTTYDPSASVLEEVYNNFKAYYPITLPRTAQSKVTPDELKSKLRSCFSCHSGLAKHAFPFLIGKLDQGDGVTVNVKIDVLRTLRACIEDYDEPEQSVVPYCNRIWGSLKYEVRNGEIEDTMWATLEVLKAVTTRLKGDNLRDYTLNVIRDCVADLSTAMYCGAAGRLILSVLSASSTSFVLMAASTMTHVKENLRHPKSLTHSQDLLKLLRAVLETRLLLMSVSLSEEDESDFAMIDPIFKNIYNEVLKQHLDSVQKPNPSEDEIKVATEVVQAAAVLICQKQTIPSAQQSTAPRLLPDTTSTEICDSLLQIVIKGCTQRDTQPSGADELINETTKALRRATGSFSTGFESFVNRIIKEIGTNRVQSSADATAIIHDLGPIMAFVACSELPTDPSRGLYQLLYATKMLTSELFAGIESNADEKTLSALIAGIHALFRYFKDACLKSDISHDATFNKRTWHTDISNKYPLLKEIGSVDTVLADAHVSANSASIADVFADFLLSGLYIVRSLYVKATTFDAEPQLASQVETDKGQYLFLLSALAEFVLHELTEEQQLSIGSESWFLNLFREDKKAAKLDWIVSTRVNVLSFGILQALRSASVSKLYEDGTAQSIIQAGITTSSYETASTAAVSRSILSILANKHKLETLEPVVLEVEKQLSTAVSTLADTKDSHGSFNQVSSILSIAAGFFRRYSGKHTQGLMKLIRQLPATANHGLTLARRLEVIIAPQQFLTKEAYATVRLLWVQKIYFDLVKPMLEAALGADKMVNDNASKVNYGVAVLALVQHIGFSIYEDDTDKIVRVAISTAQNLGTGPDTVAALTVIKTILAESSEKAEGHIRSLINICAANLSGSSSKQAGTHSPEIVAQCGKLSLEILAGLPKLFEARHLLSYAPQVDRQLSIACGHRVRDVRSAARTARMAWAEVK